MGIMICSSCGIDTCHDKGFWYTRSKNDDRFLIMFLKTGFIYHDGNTNVQCAKDHYLIFSPESTSYHTDDGNEDTGFINDWLFVSGDMCRELLQVTELPLNKAFSLSRPDIIKKCVENIQKEQMNRDACYQYKIHTLISDMLIDMGRQWKLSEVSNSPVYEVINSTRNYMFENFSRKISIADLSRMSGYSESRFCVLYNSFFGSTPIDDLLHMRIDKAKAMLLYSSLSVTEIAEKCGFSSVHYFSRKFKEITGRAPTGYKL